MSKVYLVGGGPGDPGLITVKGRRVLEQADAVLYDNLAPESLLEYAPAAAERIYVGKKKTEHAFTQEEIGRMMVERARAGKTVVRLKGGDPFIFGRGGEEMEALAAAGVPYEVVPGVTSPLGIAAYAGVPLTHRDHTRVVAFATGHHPDAVDWNTVGLSDTLVIFMGLHFAEEITRRILTAGRAPETPALVVRWGTRPDQHALEGTLETIAARIANEHITPPATIIIGDVVKLRSKLSWYEKLPLAGQSVVVTRAKRQAVELSDLLHEAGARVLPLPLIELRPPADPAPFEEAIGRLESYDWLIFTSTNAVEFFLARLDDLRRIRAKICAIGPATRAALESARLRPDLTPTDSTAEGIAQAFRAFDMAGRRVLLPRAAEARELAPDALRQLGAQVDIVEVYRNVIPDDAAEHAGHIFRPGARPPDWITLTSSSTVRNLLAVVPGELLPGVRLASIGPVTSDTARKHGLVIHAQAAEPGMAALIEAMVKAGNAR